MAKKKNLKKNGVKFGALIGAVVVLALLIYFCVRPVSVGFTYSRTYTDKILGKEITTTTGTHFNTFSKATKITKQGDNDPTETEFEYVVENGKVTLDNELLDKVTDIFGVEDGTKINAFTMGEGDNVAVCGGAIAMVTVLAVIEIVLAGVAIMSFVKKK